MTDLILGETLPEHTQIFVDEGSCKWVKVPGFRSCPARTRGCRAWVSSCAG